MLCNLKELVDAAKKEGYGVPAFNVYNLETVMGVAAAAKELNAPVIFQVYSRLFEQGTGEYLAPVILEAIRRLPVPAAFHLDHGSGELAVMRALRAGASGIMIDASLKPLEGNIESTKRVVAQCDAVGVPVEGELGHIGSTKDANPSSFTEVEEAVRYVEETGVAALAVMIGTAHGKYKQAPSHHLTAAVRAGIAKVNFGTDVCCSFLDSVFGVSRDIIALDLFMKEPVEAVKRFAMEKIRLLGADGHA